MAAAVKSIDTKDAYDKALKDAGSKLVVVDFTATWCGPCRQITPEVEKLAQTYTNVVFLKVDVDENAETAEHESIQAMPTFLFFKNETRIAEFTGASKEKITALIEKHK